MRSAAIPPRRAPAVAVALGVVTLACGLGSLQGGSGRGDGDPSPPAVAVSMPPLADLVERIGSRRVEVTVILPPGALPESWSPTPRGLLSVRAADVLLIVGHPALPFERRLERGLSGATRVLTLSGAGDRAAVTGDPHLWLDLDSMLDLASRLTDELARLDPEGEMGYRLRRAELARQIASLDRRAGRLLSSRDPRPVVVQHPAWNRFLSRYGVAELAVEPDGKEPTARSLSHLVEEARRRSVGVVFTQVGRPDRLARQVAEEIDAVVEPLDPLARRWLESIEWAVERFSAALGARRTSSRPEPDRDLRSGATFS